MKSDQRNEGLSLSGLPGLRGENTPDCLSKQTSIHQQFSDAKSGVNPLNFHFLLHFYSQIFLMGQFFFQKKCKEKYFCQKF